MHGTGNLVGGEPGATQEAGHLDHAQARDQLFQEMRFLLREAFRA